MNPVKINDTTYEVTLPSGDKVEVGDRDALDFKPCAKLKRWGEESSLVLSIPTAEKILPTVQEDKILWQGEDYGAEFLQATDGFKFNIIHPIGRRQMCSRLISALKTWTFTTSLR